MKERERSVRWVCEGETFWWRNEDCYKKNKMQEIVQILVTISLNLNPI